MTEWFLKNWLSVLGVVGPLLGLLVVFNQPLVILARTFAVIVLSFVLPRDWAESVLPMVLQSGGEKSISPKRTNKA